MVGSNRINIPVNLQMNVFTIQEVTSELYFSNVGVFFYTSFRRTHCFQSIKFLNFLKALVILLFQIN